jgi:hypothetical protein
MTGRDTTGSIALTSLGLDSPLPASSAPGDVEEEAEKDHELDAHVKDVLTRKDQIRRMLQGLWVFLKTPMGIITAIYGFLVVFWGAAIVIFLL